jgi:hypothetical protein
VEQQDAPSSVRSSNLVTQAVGQSRGVSDAQLMECDWVAIASEADARARSARLTVALLSKMGSGNRPTWLWCMPTLRDIVYENVREGELYEKLDRNRVRCFACGHFCPIPEGQPGVCKVRYNRGGTLYVPWGYAGVVQCDPIEKKPFFHAYPGALAYSFGMLGCDLHCSYCQN